MSEAWWKVKQLAVRDRTGQVATKNCAKLKPGSRGSRNIYFQRNFYLLSSVAAQPRRELALSAGKKAICSRFFRVRLGCNVTLLKLS